MKKFLLGCEWTGVDTDATEKWYASSEGWSCKCGHCRNFLKLASNRGLPQYIVRILNELNIPPEKPTYVSELYTDREGVHYHFSYRIAGQILGVVPAEQGANHMNIQCWQDPYPYGAPNFPEPYFDLAFFVVLPWVLE